MKFPLKYLTAFLILALCVISWRYRVEIAEGARKAAEIAQLQQDQANLVKGIKATGEANQTRDRALDILAWRLARQTERATDAGNNLSLDCETGVMRGSSNYIRLLSDYATDTGVRGSGVDRDSGGAGDPGTSEGR